jgi:hypothetical protein
MHFRGRHQPGRRAVLEETKEPSDHAYSTLNSAFSQAEYRGQFMLIVFILLHLWAVRQWFSDALPNRAFDKYLLQ